MKKYKRKILLVLGIFISTFLAFQPSVTFAQEVDGWEDVEIRGFLLDDLAIRTTGLRPEDNEGGDFVVGEERLRFDMSSWSMYTDTSVRLKMDLLLDVIAERFDLDLREAYLSNSNGPFDFYIGRQIATWGVGDLLFINDVFPKDWESFFTGKPLEYLKLGVDGARVRYSSSDVNAEMFIIPFFRPDNLPPPDRFFSFDPFANIPSRTEERPEISYGNTELALRLYRNISGYDISAFVYRGFWRTPGLAPDSFTDPASVTVFYPALSVYGFSAQGNAMDGVVSFEAGYMHSRDDGKGDDPAIPNSQVRFLTGYQRQLREDFTLGIQYYGELMRKHSAYRNSLPAGFPGQREYRDTITLRLTRFLEHHAYELSFFTFYSPADGDYLVQPELTWKVSDSLSATIGANIFGGEEETTFLGQFAKNDNVYLWVKHDF